MLEPKQQVAIVQAHIASKIIVVIGNRVVLY